VFAPINQQTVSYRFMFTALYVVYFVEIDSQTA